MKFYLSCLSARNQDMLSADTPYRLDAFGLEIEKIEVEGRAAKVPTWRIAFTSYHVSKNNSV